MSDFVVVVAKPLAPAGDHPDAQKSRAFVAVDGPGKRRFILSNNGMVTALDKDNRTAWVADLASQCSPEGAGLWFHISYVVERDGVLASNRDGTMAMIHCGNLAAQPLSSASEFVSAPMTIPSDAIELVGSMDGGICALEWSPDQGRLLVVTGTCSLLVLTPSWDVLAEMQAEPFDTSATVPDEPSAVSCCWRGDGQYCVIGCLDLSSSRRVVRIYKSDGLSVHAVGRNEDGSPVPLLHGPVAWSRDNTLIAMAQTIPARERLQISFFETNGLRHRELVIAGQSHTSAIVEWIGWNAESDILAVVLAPTASVEPTSSAAAPPASAAGATSASAASNVRILQLWHRDNYHWYLKHEHRFDGRHSATIQNGQNSLSYDDRRLLEVRWDAEKPHRLHYTSASGSRDAASPFSFDVMLHTVDFCWEYTVARDASTAVAVVGENGSIRLTPLAMVQTPPPQAYSTLLLQESLPPASVATASSSALPVKPEAVAPQSVCFPPQPANASTAGASTSSANSGSNGSKRRTEALRSQLAVLICDGRLVITPTTYLPPTLANRESTPATRQPVSIASSTTAAASSRSALAVHCGAKDDSGEVQIVAKNGGDGATAVDAPVPRPVVVDLNGLAMPGNGGSHASLQPWSLRHLTWVSTTTAAADASSAAAAGVVQHNFVAAATTAGAAASEVLLRIRVTVTQTESTALVVSSTPIPDGARVQWITTPVHMQKQTHQNGGAQAVDSSVAIVHTSGGEAYCVHTGSDESADLKLVCTFPEACNHVTAVVIPESIRADVQSSLGPEGHAQQKVPSLVVVGIGARTGRLLVNGHHVLTPAAGSLAWQSQHGFLLHVNLGPTPTLSFTHAHDLARVACGLPPLGNDGGGAGGPGINSLENPAAGMSNEQIAAALAAGVPLYAGVNFNASSGRALERGATLVAAVDATDQVVLQAQRGNLETVVPRPLTLARIRALLDARPVPAFGAALELARTHRVDMNLLLDHCPAATSVPLWMREAVAQVASAVVSGAVGGPSVHKKAASGSGADRWDLLLAALTEADVTASSSASSGVASIHTPATAGDATAASAAQGKYPRPHWYRGPAPPAASQPDIDDVARWLPRPSEASLLSSPSKVNRTCAHIRAALLYHMACAHPDVRSGAAAGPTPAHIVWQHPLAACVITSYARQAPADLESVLRAVQAVAASEAAAAVPGSGGCLVPSPLNVMTGDAALSHAIVVCDSDVELLYTSALGTYDIRLTHAIAQRGRASDPKEYIPFLASLTRLGQTRDGDVDAAAVDDDTAAGTTASGSSNDSTLSAGQVRQRWAIDVHLGRWGKALHWCSVMVSRSVEQAERSAAASKGTKAAWPPVRGPSGAASSSSAVTAQGEGYQDAVYLRDASRTLLPLDAESTVAAGISKPLYTLLSLTFTHSLHKAAIDEVTTGSSGSASSSSASMAVIQRSLTVTGAWSLAAGNGKPPRLSPSDLQQEAMLASRSQTPCQRLLSSTCPPSLLPSIRNNAQQLNETTEDNVRRAIDMLLSVQPAALDDAMALAAVHAHVPVVVSLAGAGATAAQGASSAEGSSKLLAHTALSIAVLPACSVRRFGSSSSSHPVSAAAISSARASVNADNDFEDDGSDGAVAATSAAADAVAAAEEPVPQRQHPLSSITVRALAEDIAKSLLSQASSTSKLAGARLLLKHCGDTEADDGIAALCDARAWVEAAAEAGAVRRLDLVDTVVLPALQSACDNAVADLQEKGEAAADVIDRLRTCRGIRSGQSLGDLIGYTEAGQHIMGDQYPGGYLYPGATDGGVDNSDNMSEVQSVFSDASSVVSGYGHNSVAGRSGVSGATGASSSSSVLSTLSVRSAKSAGVFSHWNMQNIGQTLSDTRSSLRLDAVADGAAGGGRGKQTAAAVRAMDRRERKRNQKASKVKKGRNRPGSKVEEEAIEAELAALLPTLRSAWLRDLQCVVSSAVSLGLHSAASTVVSALNSYLDILASASHPLPEPRRDIAAEVKAARGLAADYPSDAKALGLPSSALGTATALTVDPVTMLAAVTSAGESRPTLHLTASYAF